MANRYWVRNAVGNWNSTANWSTSATATPGGASVPTTGDVAIFNAAALAGNCTVNISPTVQAVNMTGYVGTLTFNSAGNFITVTSTGTVFTGSTTATIVRSGASLTGDNIACISTTTAAKTITTGAVSEANSLNFRIQSTSTGTYTLGTSVFRNFSVIDDNIATSGITVYGDLNVNSAGGAFTGSITMAPNISVAATAMVAGTTYTITSAGSTDFTLYGATSNKPNTFFTATGAGTGTGTVTPTRFLSYFSVLASSTATLNIGNGTSQGSIVLKDLSGAIYSVSRALNIQSGYFNNNNRSIIFNTNASFNYNNSNIKNIVINNTYGVTQTQLYDSNSWNGSVTNTTVDFSNIVLYTPVVLGNVTLSLPAGVYGTIYLYSQSFSENKEIYISGTNITINILRNNQFGSITQILSFDAGAVINIKQINSYTTSPLFFSFQKDFTVTTFSRSGQVTLNKIGNGIVYFYKMKLQNINATPANTWYANTTSTSGLTGNALYNATNFGQNTNLGNNSGISFNTYPPLGGFNEFF